MNHSHIRLPSLNRNFPNSNSLILLLQEINYVKFKIAYSALARHFYSFDATSLSRLVIRKFLFIYLVIMLSVIIGNYSVLTC